MSDHEKKIFHGRTFFVGHKTNIMCLQSKYIRSDFFLVVSRGVSTAEGWDREGGRDCISLLTILWV